MKVLATQSSLILVTDNKVSSSDCLLHFQNAVCAGRVCATRETLSPEGEVIELKAQITLDHINVQKNLELIVIRITDALDFTCFDYKIYVDDDLFFSFPDYLDSLIPSEKPSTENEEVTTLNTPEPKKLNIILYALGDSIFKRSLKLIQLSKNHAWMFDRSDYPLSPIPTSIRVSALVGNQPPEFVAGFLSDESSLLITDEESYAAIQQSYVKNDSVLKIKNCIVLPCGDKSIDYFGVLSSLGGGLLNSLCTTNDDRLAKQIILLLNHCLHNAGFLFSRDAPGYWLPMHVNQSFLDTAVKKSFNVSPTQYDLIILSELSMPYRFSCLEDPSGLHAILISSKSLGFTSDLFSQSPLKALQIALQRNLKIRYIGRDLVDKI